MGRVSARQPFWGGHTGPRPSGSATSRKRPKPRASVSSGWPHRTQRRGGRLEGGKGTRRSVRRPCAPRQFPAGYVLGAAAAAAGAGELLADELLVLLVLLVEEDELLVELLGELLLLESELLALSFLVEL